VQEKDATRARRSLSGSSGFNKSSSFVGVIITEPQRLVSKSDKPYVTFGFQELKSSKIYKAMLFDNLALSEPYRVGSRVSIRGQVNDDSLFVSVIASTDQQSIKRLSPDEAKKKSAELASWYDAQGMAAVFEKDETGKVKKHWFNKTSLVETSPGTWIRKIDYIMDVLGPAETTKRLREKLKELSVQTRRVGKVDVPLMGKAQGRAIQVFIEQLYVEATF